MNNVVLDVAIGLVFIYLLYSLLATTIKEFIATLFSYRARMLEKGIEQMLDGKSYSYYWWDRLYNNRLNKKNKDNEKSKYYNKKNLFANLISCHPLYKRSGENSKILKNEKPAYLSADVFSDILIDVLKPNKDAPTLLKDIATSVKARAADNNDPLNNDLEKILSLYLQQANGDVQRFRLLIETWYNDTMDRVSGWYKRQANRILILIGLCLAIAFNVSTIDIVRKLSEDKDARNALVQNAEDYIKANANKFGPVKSSPDSNTISQKSNKTDSSQQANKSDTSGKQLPQSVINKAIDTTLKKSDTSNAMDDAKLGLKRIDSLYKENIAEANTTLGLGWGDYGLADSIVDSLKTQYISQYKQYMKDSINYVTCQKQHLPKCIKPHKPKQKWILHWYQKLWYIIWQTLSTPHYLIGFLITAFAISLGAPFWFDLLNRFVNLRVSGAKPNEGTTPQSKTSSLNQKPDPTAKG